MTTQSDSPGDRVFQIRLALGDGRYPLSQAKLADRLTALSGKKYEGTMVTKMEKGTRRVSAEDARWLAMLDPAQRGAPWVLCWPDAVSGAIPRAAEHTIASVPIGKRYTDEQVANATRVAGGKKQAKAKRSKKKRPGHGQRRQA